MQLIQKYLNPDEAQIACSYLRANGINAEVEGAHSQGAMPHVGMGATMLRVVAPASQVEDAKALLADATSADPAKGDVFPQDYDFGEPESENTGGGIFIPYRMVFVVLIALLFIYYIL